MVDFFLHPFTALVITVVVFVMCHRSKMFITPKAQAKSVSRGLVEGRNKSYDRTTGLIHDFLGRGHAGSARYKVLPASTAYKTTLMDGNPDITTPKPRVVQPTFILDIGGRPVAVHVDKFGSDHTALATYEALRDNKALARMGVPQVRVRVGFGRDAKYAGWEKLGAYDMVLPDGWDVARDGHKLVDRIRAAKAANPAAFDASLATLELAAAAERMLKADGTGDQIGS